MAEIEQDALRPGQGPNRIGSMVEGRPDWVLSRQRAWGVPITLFVDRESGEYLVDRRSTQRIIAAVAQDGVDAWDEEQRAGIARPRLRRSRITRWSPTFSTCGSIRGSTHAFVLESGRWPDLQWPADLYLEGSDQHRGWFQSSLLESCATRGRAPYNAVLTHGFTMAADGRKMSKSLGNTIDPLKVMEQYGADIIRLWALSVDYTEDHRIGDEILKGVADQYRKLRNTFRYMLGALGEFDESERVDVADMPELERYVLALLGELDAKLRRHVDNYDFNAYTRALVDFCNEDLSAFFFDIRKDCLYCDAPGSAKRRAYRTVLDMLFHALVRYAAPVLVFTAEEVWGTRYPEGGSVHLLEWPEMPGAEADAERWDALRALRERVTEAIEPLRREKIIRSEPRGRSHRARQRRARRLHRTTISPSCSSPRTVTLGDGRRGERGANPTMHKCGRCWRLLPEVPEDGALCDRCEDVVAATGCRSMSALAKLPPRSALPLPLVIFAIDQWVKMVRGRTAWPHAASAITIDAAAVLRFHPHQQLRRLARHVRGDIHGNALVLVGVTALIALVVLVWMLREKLLGDILGARAGAGRCARQYPRPLRSTAM